MPAPFFTNNDSEFTRLEGLYVKERNPPAVLQGIFLGKIGVVGECVRGPVDKVVEIGSEARFREVFGWRDKGSGGAILGMVWKSLINKRFGTLCVVRAAAAAAVKATANLSNAVPTAIVRVEAASPGTWANGSSGGVTLDVVDATDGTATKWDLLVNYLGVTYRLRNLNTDSTNDNLESVVGTDDGTLIRIVKLANGRPINSTGTNLGSTTAGTDGTIADSDFTAAGRGINVIAAYPGLGAVFIAERSSTALKNQMEIAAATATDRLFLLCADSDTTSVASAVTDVANYRSDRIVYCFNHPYTIDPETAGEIVTHPTSWLAAVLSQIDVDIHPGEEDTKPFLAGITRLSFPALTRSDYITLRDAGICALENDDGFVFLSGVTTSLTPGKTEMTRRRMADYLQHSLAKGLKFNVKKKNTLSRRKAIYTAIDDFLDAHKKAERVVEDYSIDAERLNTATQRTQGVEKDEVRVRLIGHILHLVFETEIGTAVVIREAA